MVASVRLLATMVLGAAVLSGCSGTVMQSRIDRPGADQFFRYGAAPGEMKAVVVGNPFPVPKQEVDQAVVDAMQRNHNGPMTHFSTNPGPEAHKDYRIVMAFNTPTAFQPENLCKAPDTIPSGKDVKDLKLLAGFCVGDTLYSRAKVSATSISSPSDPRFKGMVQTAMRELVPVKDPFDQDDSCKWRQCS